MNVKVFELAEIHPKAIKLLEKNAQIVESKDVDAIVVRSYTKVNAKFLKDYPKLKYIVRVGVGLDTIDVNVCEKRGIKIFNSPGANANAVSEMVVLYTLLLKRKLFGQIASLKNNKWRDRTQIGTEIKGNTVGIIGCGAIGRLVARKFLGFGVEKILGYDPFMSAVQLKQFSIIKSTLPEIYKNADIISLHVPLVPETKNMVSLTEFEQMKRNALVINTSRGGIVNEKDLIVALEKNIIAGAALDVFENEPKVNEELLKLDNLITTPHIGALTEEAEEAMAVQAVQQFLSVAV